MTDTATAPATLSPEDIKERIADLDAEQDANIVLITQTNARQRAIGVEIQRLQAQCTHPSSTEDMVSDVAEFKLRNFCNYCRTIV